MKYFTLKEPKIPYFKKIDHTFYSKFIIFVDSNEVFRITDDSTWQRDMEGCPHEIFYNINNIFTDLLFKEPFKARVEDTGDESDFATLFIEELNTYHAQTEGKFWWEKNMEEGTGNKRIGSIIEMDNDEKGFKINVCFKMD